MHTSFTVSMMSDRERSSRPGRHLHSIAVAQRSGGSAMIGSHAVSLVEVI
jgi:hypothetical protein